MIERTLMKVMKVLPKSALSRAVGGLTRAPVPAAMHHAAAKLFAYQFRIDLGEAEHPLDHYGTFGEFFTRRLRPGTRPIASGDDVVVSPVDALVAAAGVATDGRMLQAKGRDYSVAALLDDPEQARRFIGGTYLTLYLSPRDYHRIHAPVAGDVTGFRYIPGTLFPVNAPAVRQVVNLFCVNERLVSYLRSPAGTVAVVKVGATCVGRIRASYDDVVTNAGAGAASRTYDAPKPIAKGAELGMFEMGSTVILLFEPGKVELDPSVIEGARVRVGQAIAHIK